MGQTLVLKLGEPVEAWSCPSGLVYTGEGALVLKVGELAFFAGEERPPVVFGSSEVLRPAWLAPITEVFPRKSNHPGPPATFPKYQAKDMPGLWARLDQAARALWPPYPAPQYCQLQQPDYALRWAAQWWFDEAISVGRVLELDREEWRRDKARLIKEKEGFQKGHEACLSLILGHIPGALWPVDAPVTDRDVENAIDKLVEEKKEARVGFEGALLSILGLIPGALSGDCQPLAIDSAVVFREVEGLVGRWRGQRSRADRLDEKADRQSEKIGGYEALIDEAWNDLYRPLCFATGLPPITAGVNRLAALVSVMSAAVGCLEELNREKAKREALPDEETREAMGVSVGFRDRLTTETGIKLDWRDRIRALFGRTLWLETRLGTEWKLGRVEDLPNRFRVDPIFRRRQKCYAEASAGPAEAKEEEREEYG